jgi:beta-glucuronidase
MSGLAASCRELDPTRLVSAACLINREHFRVEDRLSEALDVIGLNEYFGWYEPSFDGLKRLFANSDLDKPLVITETGADAVAGREGRPGELFGETHQSDLYERQLDLVESAPYVRGFCPWILYDFRTERRQTAYQRGWNLKGLIAADKTTRKKAFTTLSERYSELAQQQTPAGA